MVDSLCRQNIVCQQVLVIQSMASTKKTGFLVETKSIPEKKRRKSDLVVMWMTLWEVFLYGATEIWTTFQGILEASKYFFKSDEVWQIREWLEEYLPKVPSDFSHSWRDGILFCKLLDKLQPGSYPEANRLDTNFGVRNFTKAFRILESRFDLIPKVSVEELVSCCKDSEPKLIDLLLQLKQKSDALENNIEVKISADEKENERENGANEIKHCIAKGTGLMVGFVGRAASFGVFFSSLSDLNLVVEIRGPCNTICSERVTQRSPKKKNVIQPWKPLSPHAIIRSSSNEENKTSIKDSSHETPTDNEKCLIPLEYNIHSNQISFTYYPLIQGEHKISIHSHGPHVSDSPYSVTVEPSVKSHKIEGMAHIKSVLKPVKCCQKEDEEKSTVRFQEPSERKERLGKILKRQVLRYIVKIDGKDVVVDTDSIENLATSLLKMDYELQKRPLVRRNSWGFVGDAERKISVIRQFGIDMDELEAQSIKMQRSHSLSFSPSTKKPPKISSSYECEDINQQTILETVTEGRISHFNNCSQSFNQEDDVFALINGDFCRNEIDRNDDAKQNLILNSSQNSEHKTKENLFCYNSQIELDQTSSEEQVQTAIKTEFTNKENITAEATGDTSATMSEGSSRLEIHIDEESPEKTTTKKGKDVKENSLTSETSFISNNQKDNDENGEQHIFVESDKTISGIENHAEFFKDLEINNELFIEELPCTKTEAKRLSNHNYDKKIFRSLDIKNSCLCNYENSNKISKKGNLHYNLKYLKYSNSKTNKSNNPINNCHCKCHSETTAHENKFKIFNRKKMPMNEQYESKNIDNPKIISKSIAYSDIKKNNIRYHRLHKYQHLGQKGQSNYASYCAKTHRSSSKSLVENPMTKELKSIIQNLNYKNNPTVSKTLLKSTKNRTVSDPTYNSFNRSKGSTNFEYKENENGCLETKNDKNNEINKINSNFVFQQLTDNNSCQSNQDSKVVVNREECGTKFWPVPMKADIEPQTRRKNFNINHHSQKDNEHENFSVCSKDSKSNHSRESFTKSFDGNSSDLSNSKDSCQFTYKHFNPSLQNYGENLVKKQVTLWENSTADKNAKPISKCIDKMFVLPELIDIKAKLRFWENTCRQLGDEEQKERNISRNPDDLHEKKESNDISKPLSSGINLGFSNEKQSHLSLEYESKEENNKNNSELSAKSIEGKMLQLESSTGKKRCFSDPGILDQSVNEIEDDAHLSSYNNPVSSKDEMSSSNDGNFIELFADDEDSSMELLCSTEDEYIDDEISENISTYWGDLSLMKDLKAYDSSEYEEFLQLMNSEFLQSRADECKFFGIATYFGHVAVKNRFWVLTKGAGRGNLSTSVQGIGQHNVAFVSVEYTRKDIYEVTYQVFTPGLYLISVRWMDAPIPGSPYLCKVTF